MAWSVTAGTVASADAVGSLASNAPAGVQVGDLLVLCAACAVSGTITTPSGWDLIESGSDGFSAVRGAMFRRIAGGTADDTPTVALASGTRDMASVILRITGQAASTPFDASAIATQTSGATPAIPPLTTALAEELLVGFIAIDTNWDATPDPSGWTQRALLNIASPILVGVGVWTKEAPAAGSHGGETATLAGSNQAVRISAAFKPAAGGGPAAVANFAGGLMVPGQGPANYAF